MIEELAPRFGYDPHDIQIKTIGVIPGEKLYEELMSSEETRRTIELESYFVVLPALRPIYNVVAYDYPDLVQNCMDHAYNSENERAMSIAELRSLLVKGQLLEEALQSFHLTSPLPPVAIGAPHLPLPIPDASSHKPLFDQETEITDLLLGSGIIH